MQLITFQVKDCFGFRDSGEIDLHGPGNLIYVLGRNSSGKTALLSALASLAPETIPQDHPKFRNFNPSNKAPHLIATYSLRPGDMSSDALDEEFRRLIDAANIGSGVVTSSPEYQKLVQAIEQDLDKVYGEVIGQLEAQGRFVVLRFADGNYRFTLDGTSMKEYSSRQAKVKESIERNLASVRPGNPPGVNQNQLLVSGAWYTVNLPAPKEIENLLARQLPDIDWFTGNESTFPLRDDLPDKITMDELRGDQRPLVEAFIEFLGREKLREVLTVQNPVRRRTLEQELQTRANELTTAMNRTEVGTPDLIQLDLDRAEGLQVTIDANGKPSFYRHISDNTKFLFAYYLYRAVHGIQNAILLFDEPNNGFHATAQEQLLNFLEALGRDGNLVIVSTHSEHLIDPDRLGGIRLMDVDEEGYLRVLNHWYGRPKDPDDFQSLRPLFDAIGLKYGTNKLTIRDKVIVVEGVTDLLYLRGFRQILGHESDLHIAPARGDDTIPHLVSLIISQGLRFKIVVDESVGKENAKKSLEDELAIPASYIYEVPIPQAFKGKATGAGIEDVFSKADFAKLLANAGLSVDGGFEHVSNGMYMADKHRRKLKRVVAEWFLNHAGHLHDAEFDAETLANARTVLDFCTSEHWLLV